jgi:hypothetical protein
MSDSKPTDPFEPEKKPEQPAVPETLDALLKQFGDPSQDEIVAEAQESAKAAAKVKAAKSTVPPAPKKGKAEKVKPQPHPAALAQVSTHVRQTVVNVLKATSPKDYEAYVAMKFAGVAQGDRPSLEQSRKAYEFAFGRFLALTYKESGV